MGSLESLHPCYKETSSLLDRLCLESGHDGPDFVKCVELLPLIREAGDLALEIRVIERQGQFSHDVDKVRLPDDHPVAVVRSIPCLDDMVLAGEQEQVLQVLLEAAAHMEFILCFLNDTVESVLSCEPHAHNNSRRGRT